MNERYDYYILYSMQRGKILKFFLQCHTFVACVFCFLALGLNKLSLNSTTVFDKRSEFNAPYQVSGSFVRLISAGYWFASSDWFWIQSLSVISTSQYSDLRAQLLRGYYNIILDLDRDFYEVYEQAGIAFSVLFEKPDYAIEFLERGAKRYREGSAPQAFWTHPYSLYIHLAYVYGFEINDWAKSKEAYLNASKIKGAPIYLTDMSAWLKEEGSERVLAVKILKVLIRNASDELVRKRYIEKLKEYES